MAFYVYSRQVTVSPYFQNPLATILRGIYLNFLSVLHIPEFGISRIFACRTPLMGLVKGQYQYLISFLITCTVPVGLNIVGTKDKDELHCH